MNTKSILVVAIVMTAVISLASGTAQARLLWGVDSGSGDLVNFDPWTGTEYTRYPLPSILSSDTEIGLAGWESELFYINGNSNPGRVYVLDPEDGSTITEYNIEGGWNVNGLGYASGSPGSYLYTSGCSVGDMHRYVAADGSSPTYFWGNSIQNRNAVGGDHGGRIFTPLADGLSIAEVDPWVDKDPLNTIPSPSETIVGMAYDGEYLYASDTSNYVYIMNADTGVVVNTIQLCYTLYALGSTEGNPFNPIEVEKDYRYTSVCFEKDNDGDGLFNEDPIDGIDNDLDGLIDEDPVDCEETSLGTLLPTDTDGDYIVEAVVHKNGKVSSYNPGQYYAVSTVNVLMDVDTLTIEEDWDDCDEISALNPANGGGSVVIVEIRDGEAYQIFDAKSDEVTVSGNTATATLGAVPADTTILMYVKFGPAMKGETWVDTIGPCENTNAALVSIGEDSYEEEASAMLELILKE